MVHSYIKALVDYAVGKGLIFSEDRAYAVNRLLEILQLDSFEECRAAEGDLEEILGGLLDYAEQQGLLQGEGVVYRDLFDTKLMGALTPRPSWVIERFWSLYRQDREKATDFYYAFSRNSDYIRTYRIRKDVQWKVNSAYGEMDVTINLSKPEKDPKAIAAAKQLPQSGYPKCLLCLENEGYAGRINSPARQNHRIIPLEMAGQQWFLQYSPYVYYNEHCIAFSAEHTPMKIDRLSFEKILSFIELFPHYFIGSNADLPIVGGSILSHDHMQGGRYEFAMAKAPIEIPLLFDGFEDVSAGIVKWPMSVIRLIGTKKERLVELADRILLAWRGYTDENARILAHSDGEDHNTVTPIGRKRGESFELDLVLRCNLTTPEHPEGLYHPHRELHNIKKENIGLIEVMGLAVLPARLKGEMELLEEAILAGRSVENDPVLAKHASWFASFRDAYSFNKENTAEILRAEIGKTFVRVLEDAGVYKCSPEGRADFLRFAEAVNRR